MKKVIIISLATGLVAIAIGIGIGWVMWGGSKQISTTNTGGLQPTVTESASTTVIPSDATPTPVSQEDPIWAKLQQTDVTIEKVTRQACGEGNCPAQETEGLYAIGKSPVAFRENLSTGILKSYLASGDSNYIPSAVWLNKVLYFVGKDGVYRLNPSQKSVSALYQTSWTPDSFYLFLTKDKTALISAYYDSTAKQKGKVVVSTLKTGDRKEYTFNHIIDSNAELLDTYAEMELNKDGNYIWIAAHVEPTSGTAVMQTLVRIDLAKQKVEYIKKSDIPAADRPSFYSNL